MVALPCDKEGADQARKLLALENRLSRREGAGVEVVELFAKKSCVSAPADVKEEVEEPLNVKVEPAEYDDTPEPQAEYRPGKAKANPLQVRLPFKV